MEAVTITLSHSLYSEEFIWLGTPNVTYTIANGNTVSSLLMPGLLHKAVLSEVCGYGEGESETHVSGTGDQSRCGALRVT